MRSNFYYEFDKLIDKTKLDKEHKYKMYILSSIDNNILSLIKENGMYDDYLNNKCTINSIRKFAKNIKDINNNT